MKRSDSLLAPLFYFAGGGFLAWALFRRTDAPAAQAPLPLPPAPPPTPPPPTDAVVPPPAGSPWYVNLDAPQGYDGTVPPPEDSPYYAELDTRPPPPEPPPEAVPVSALPDWNPAPPAGFTRYRGSVDQEIIDHAKAALSQPYGSWLPFTHSDGRRMGILLEKHYHEPGGPVKPWGWHKGSSVFVEQGVSA